MKEAPSNGSMHVTELDRMICRTQVACERYRQAANKPGLTPPRLGRKIQTLKKMEDTLARLLAQRDAHLQ